MPIGSLPEGQTPRVEELEGEIVIWVNHADGPIGLSFSAKAGLDVGFNCLNVASKLLGYPTSPLSTAISIEDNVDPSEEVAGRLVVTIEEAPFEILLTGTQVCEFAAQFTAMAKRLDL